MPLPYISARFHADDSTGRPLVGGQLFTFVNNTTTPSPTYQDAAGTSLNPNPIILDARGEAVVFVDENQVYTFQLLDADGVVVRTDNDVVPGGGSGGGGGGGSGLPIYANAPPTDVGPVYITSQGPAEFGANGYESLYSTGYGGGSWGFKNKMRNGGFTVSQRVGPFVQASATTGVFTLDNAKLFVGSNAKYTISQGQDLTTTQQGALGVRYLKIVSNSAVSPASTDKNKISMAIEGYDVAQFGMGSAVIKNIAISFRVRSTLTGTFYASITNDTASRSYCFSFAVAAVNIWQKITVLVPIDTLNGTDWKKDTNAGFVLNFDLGSGINFETPSPNTWQAGHYLRSSGALRLCSTNAAELHITQVQVEEGTQPTPFEVIPIALETIRCKRYFQYVVGSLGGYSGGVGGPVWSAVSWPTMRDIPAITFTSRGSGSGFSSVTYVAYTEFGGALIGTAAAGGSVFSIREAASLDAEMTYV